MSFIRFILILLTVVEVSCSSGKKDEIFPTVSEASLLSFNVWYNGITYPAERTDGRHWHVNLPVSVTDKFFQAKYELEEGVSITPSPNLFLDYTNPVVFTLFDKAGNTLKITVTCSNDRPYYGIWLEAGDRKFYPVLEKDEYLIIVPGDITPKVNYKIEKGATISPEPDLSIWPENERKEFVITRDNGSCSTIAYRWIRDDFFTMVVLGDPEYDMRNYSLNGGEIKSYVGRLLKLKERKELYFEPYAGLKIKYDPSLVLIVGDINMDNSKDEGEEFMQVFGALYNAGIPCIAIAGNHDWQPYHWGDLSDYQDKNDYGYTLNGSMNNDRTLKMIDRSIAESEKLGITDVHRFLSTDYGHSYREVSPFVFRFKGIRFYCGQCYWFQQWYQEVGLFPTRPAMFYNTDEIIEDLEQRIDYAWAKEPAVWLQHYPLTDQKEWWHDRQGFSMDSAANKSKWQTYEEKLEVLKNLIYKTTNPVFFAGHTHQSANYTHTNGSLKFEEWVTGYFHDRWVYVVLLKENYGVVDVKKIQL